jgi:hypothetical protein
MKAFFCGFKGGFLMFSKRVSHAINFVLLTLVYVLAIGAPSLIGKARGKEFLSTHKERDSYWEDRKESSRHDRMF